MHQESSKILIFFGSNVSFRCLFAIVIVKNRHIEEGAIQLEERKMIPKD